MRKLALIFLALLSFEAAYSQSVWGGYLFNSKSANNDSVATFSAGAIRSWFAANLKSFSAVQDAVASVGSGSGTAAGNVATITGATGGATSANSGTVTGGVGGGIVGTGGNGGAITGTPGTGIGGAGGAITLTSGDGGTGTTFGGNGGNANIQAGNGGNGTTPGTGGYAALKAGNGSSSGNSAGGNVFLVGGAKTGSGQDGDIYLGVSPSFTARGKIKVGGSSAPAALITIGEEGSKLGTISVAGSASGTITIQPAAAAGTYTLTLPTTDGAASEFLQTDGSGALSWAASSGGIGTLNTLTASTQTFATGTAGTDFAISSATSTHTFNLPTASGSNRGALSSSDWSTFNGKQAAGNYITALTGDVTASGPGSVSATVTKINGTSLAGLATGILKNTTATGVPSIAIAGDFPTLNQNTTGSAATLTTARTISGTGDATFTTTAFDGSAAVSGAITVTKINGVSLAGLSTGILKNTTTTGAPSIAVAGDFPTLNQNTTGSAATLTTPRAIYGNNFDGSAALTQIIASTYGGTGNGFTKFSGPATSEKTFTLPNATATILTDNAAVTVAQGGTGRATSTTAYGLIAAGTTATGAHQTLAAGATTEILVGGGASALPVWATATGSGAPVRATSPTLVTPALGTPSAGNLTNCINLSLTTGVAGTLPVANGGTGTASTLVGLVLGNASAMTAITSTTAGQIPRCTGSNTFAFGALDLADADAITGVLPFANGGMDVVSGRATAQTAANNSVATLTVGGADATYMVSGNILITTSSAEAFSLTVDYTDEGNTARSVAIPIVRIATGGFTAVTISASGAVPYPSTTMQIRCKASTAITIKTSGTFTGCTYNVEGKIAKL